MNTRGHDWLEMSTIESWASLPASAVCPPNSCVSPHSPNMFPASCVWSKHWYQLFPPWFKFTYWQHIVWACVQKVNTQASRQRTLFSTAGDVTVSSARVDPVTSDLGMIRVKPRMYNDQVTQFSYWLPDYIVNLLNNLVQKDMMANK